MGHGGQHQPVIVHHQDLAFAAHAAVPGCAVVVAGLSLMSCRLGMPAQGQARARRAARRGRSLRAAPAR
jgi:hypothetical protein